jgi:hypothetical protein
MTDKQRIIELFKIIVGNQNDEQTDKRISKTE